MSDRLAGVVLETQVRLKEFRLKEGLSQKELSLALGKAPSTVTRYESGTFVIPIDVVRILKDKFNVSYEWFFNGTGSMKILPQKSNILSDISVLFDNDSLVLNRLKNLESEFKKLHRELHALKNNIK